MMKLGFRKKLGIILVVVSVPVLLVKLYYLNIQSEGFTPLSTYPAGNWFLNSLFLVPVAIGIMIVGFLLLFSNKPE